MRLDAGSPASFNAFLEACLDQMLTLMEAEPANRRIPDLIVQLDAVRANRSKRPLLADAISSARADQVGLDLVRMGVAEAKKGAKR